MSEIIVRSHKPSTLGEGTLWSPRDGCVYWVDILGHKLHSLELEHNKIRSWDFGEPIGWVVAREKGGFIAGLMSGPAEVTLEPFSVKHIVNPYPHEPENRLNDAKADNRGRIWFGSMHKPIEKTSGAFYRLETDLSFKEIDAPYTIANGPTFSKDFSRIYHTDTDKHEIYVFDMDENGEAVNKRLFLRFLPAWGYPDGMTTDADDGIWVAHWGGSRVTRFLPDGREDFHIEMPASQITNITFGGDKLDRMFVSSAADGQPTEKLAGHLFEVPRSLLRGITGLTPQTFKG
jgi:xylono-1,5-lactonase